MTTTPATRPEIITHIGWSFVGAGALIALFLFIRLFSGLPASSPPSGFEFLPLRIVFEQSVLLTAVHAGVLAATLVGAAALLHGQAWARPLLEVTAWLLLGGVVTFGVLMERSMLALPSHLPAHMQSVFTPLETVLIGGISTTSLAVPCVAAIIALRTKKLRDALDSWPAPAGT